ncbi:MAG: hypothetical protein R2758_03255 [Bacteroidales bacterium]
MKTGIMVSVNNVSLLFGSFILLDEVSFLITRQERDWPYGKERSREIDPDENHRRPAGTYIRLR